MGIVFKAFEPALEREVAIKVLRSEFASNPSHVHYFLQEARSLAALRHPNILPIYFIGEVEGCAFFSMPFIYGETLEDYIRRDQWLSEDSARWFLTQAISALHAAHLSNIIHLDIKPANFLIDQQNTLLLSDFGLAERIVKEEDDNPKREAFGTPAYVSPEQIYRKKTDQRTDIYSLGATLFHLMVGKPPYPGETTHQIVWGHMEKPFPVEAARDAGLSPGWICLIQKMMARNPDDRFANYEELYAALQDVKNFRNEVNFGGMPASVVAPVRPNLISLPRSGLNTATLHGLLSPDGPGWIVSKDIVSPNPHLVIKLQKLISEVTEEERPLPVSKMAHSIESLCTPFKENPNDLVAAMKKVPGYHNALIALAKFMVHADTGSPPLKPIDLLRTVGMERSRNLALMFYSLNFERGKHPQFKLLPIWRHQLAVALILDFMYDALDIKRSGLEFVVGAFHDVGKIVLAELYPESYYYTLARSLLYEVPLSKCEHEAFCVDHAEIGAYWLQHHNINPAVINVISEHENALGVNKRAVLVHGLISANHFAKQLGLGFSGNTILGPLSWEELPSTRIIWSARRSFDYKFQDFTRDFLTQFETFPELI